MGFTGYKDIVTKYRAGKRYYYPWQKASTTFNGAGWRTMWPPGGNPQAGTYTGTALNAQQCIDTTVGAMQHGGDVSSLTKHLLRWNVVNTGSLSTNVMTLLLVDRLLYYPGINATITTNQAFTNGVTLPRYTDGKGVRAWIEPQGNQPVGFATPAVFTYGDNGYTSSDGTGGRQHADTVNMTGSATAADPFIPHTSAITANRSWNPFLPMQNPDVGMKSVESVKLTTAYTTSGTLCLVLGKPLASLILPVTDVVSEKDFTFQSCCLERIYDGACLMVLAFVSGGSAAQVLWGELEFAWG